MKENQIRHSQNLSILDRAFYHGTYYERGIPRLPKKGVIFDARGRIKKEPRMAKVQR